MHSLLGAAAASALLQLLFSISTVSGVSWEEWWTYDGISGPAFWGLINPEWSLCNKGRRQSPVNLEPEKLLFDPNLRFLHIDKHRINGLISNTGHSVIFTVENETRHHINITGGPLSYKYQFHEIHIHYGLHDQFGSEHAINGYSFPAEIQIFGFNSQLYSNFSEALHKAQGIVSISLLLQALNERVNELQRGREEDKRYIAEMETRLESAESLVRDCSVDVVGIPSAQNEDLYQHIEELGRAVGVPLQRADLSHCSRKRVINVATAGRPRTHQPITVRFVHKHKRDEFLKKTRLQKGNPLTTEALRIQGYELISRMRRGRRGGGVAFYVRSRLAVQVRRPPPAAAASPLEQLWIHVTLGDLSNPELRSLTEELEHIKYGGAEMAVNKLSVRGLLPETDYYMTYDGSTTAPACFETVTWIIVNKPIYITKQQLHGLRRLMQGDARHPKAPLGNNFRPPQPLHHRAVRTNIDFELNKSSRKTCPSMHRDMHYKAKSWTQY